MAELTLRVSNEFHKRLMLCLSRHGLSKADFCRNSVKLFNSGKIKPVTQNELLNCVTYKGPRIRVRNWESDLKGEELLAILIDSLIRLEKAKVVLPPKIDLIKGIDYNISTAELLKQHNVEGFKV